jgi:hypothetical protein
MLHIQAIGFEAPRADPRRGFIVRLAFASLAIALLSDCAVQICGNEFPYRTNSCLADSLAPISR